MPAKGTTKKNLEKVMDLFAQWLVHYELKDPDFYRDVLGMDQNTQNAFAKRFHVGKNTLSNWLRDDSPFWERLTRTDRAHWKRKRSVAMMQLLRHEPTNFLRMTFPEETRAALAIRSEVRDITGAAPEDMTDEELERRIAELEEEKKNAGGKTA